MMTFLEILDAIDTLSDEQLTQLEHRIFQKRKNADIPHLSAFEALSDSALWDIIHQPFDIIKDNRLHQLQNLRDYRHLTADEEHEEDELMHAFDIFIIRRSMAMVTLQKRGVDVMAKLSETE